MRPSPLLVTLLTLVVVPGTDAQEAPLRVPYTQFTLANGLNVILHQDRSTPIVSVNVWYHVGSGREKPGRTGFAHLFEHIMFEGSAHVPEGRFDAWLEAAGGNNNGSTNSDRTNYWDNVPSNAVELALFLESDRMGYLLETMSPTRVDGQRDVVKNERRQSYENRPYGLAFPTLMEALYPPDHPYHWPTIGSMEDLTAASHQDVVEFFERFYGPNNASIAIAGDIDPEEMRSLVQKWFGDIASGPPVPPIEHPEAYLDAEKRLVLEDRVQLPRLYVCWLSPPRFAPGDAELDVTADILAGGKNSRLYRRLVYDLQIAQDVTAFQLSSQLSSQFCLISTARPDHTLGELEAVIREELGTLKSHVPTDREVQRATHRFEADFLDRLESVGGFGGKADMLNSYFQYTGNPDYFNEDLTRYRAVDGTDVTAVARTILRDDRRVVLSVVPEGQQHLAANGKSTSE